MIWWLIPILALIWFFIWCVVHEGSHIIGAKIEGITITGFKPYPSRSESGFRFASWSYTGGPPTFKTTIAPYVTDLIAFLCMIPFMYYVQRDWVWTSLAITAAAPLVNSVTASIGWLRKTQTTDLIRAGGPWGRIVVSLSVVYLALYLSLIILRFSL